MRVLLTGGAGFIGSNFVNWIIENTDADLFVIDALTYAGNLDNFTPSVWGSTRFHFIKGNICDSDVLYPLLKKVDYVIHLAAWTHIDRSLLDITPFIETNIKGTGVLLEGLRKYHVKRLVHVSTCEVYGEAKYLPIDEQHPKEPLSPYAVSKLAGEQLVQLYQKLYKIPAVILRPFNIFGPRQYPEKLIPFFIINAMLDNPLPIYGDGTAKRDWLYVDDLPPVIWKIMEMEGVDGEVLNIATGKGMTINEIADCILNTLDKPKTLKRHVEEREGHIKQLIGSYKKVEQLLGWSPTVEFNQGLRKTITWYKENREWWTKILRRDSYRKFVKSWYKGRIQLRL